MYKEGINQYLKQRVGVGDEGVQCLGEYVIGDLNDPKELVVGEGDSHVIGLKVFSTSDDVTYVDYTDEASSGAGSTYPTFGGFTNAGAADYIGSDYPICGIKLNTASLVTPGSGAVAREYWNGSAWTEFNGMSTGSDSPYAYYAKDYFEQPVGTHIRYNIEMTNDDWTANDPMGRGENKKWVRYRIATAITESFTIDQIKLHPSRWEANSDGFNEFFGDARFTSLLPLNIGSAQPLEGNMQSRTLYVDQNIGVGFQNNRFTATTDILGFNFSLPDNIDTGCPINFVWSGRSAVDGSITWIIRWKIVNAKNADMLLIHRAWPAPIAGLTNWNG